MSQAALVIRLAAVTVCTKNVALCNLCHQSLDGYGFTGRVTDAEFLVSVYPVIKLQNDWV